MKSKFEIQEEIARLSESLIDYDSNQVEFKLIEQRREALEWVLGYIDDYGSWIGPAN